MKGLFGKDKIVALVGQVFRASSVELIEGPVGGISTLREPEPNRRCCMTPDEHTSAIQLTHAKLKIRFIVRFAASAAQQLGARMLEMDPQEFTAKMGIDFINEFCNQTAGQIKQRLPWLDRPVRAALSIPLNGALGSVEARPDDTWIVVDSSGHDYLCTLELEVTDPTFFVEMIGVELETPGALRDEETVEFF